MSPAHSMPQRHPRRRTVGAARGGRHGPEPLVQRIYRLLSDRRFHSGPVLAEHCAVSRSTIWKTMATLRSLGVEVEALADRGYRLPLATALLDSRRIIEQLPVAAAKQLLHGETRWQTSSTNSELLERSLVAPGQFEFLSAEYQTAG